MGDFVSVAQQFLRRTGAAPGSDAVVTTDRRITYEALAGAAGAVQHALERTDPSGGPVAILSTDSIDRAAAILGVTAAGRAFVLMDPARGPEGLAAAAEPIGARTAVGAEPPEVFPWRVCQQELGEERLRPRAVTPVTPFAYVSTSGSTGDPRYVLRCHAATHNPPGSDIELRPEDRIFRAFNYSGAAPSQLLAALAVGACHLSLDPLRVPPSQSLAFLREERATVVNATPSVLQLMFRNLPVSGGLPLPRLRCIGGGGEPMAWSEVVRLRALGPMSSVVRHGYASSETRAVTRRFITSDEAIGVGHVPAGRPVTGRRVWIADRDGGRAAPGVVGTIIIEGRFGTVGPNFEQLPDGWLRFRSGDVGEMSASGELIHRGRHDGVVKVGAVRIDPGAVEDVLHQMDGIEDVRVIPVPLETGGVRLVAHVRASGTASVDPVELRKYAAARLVSNAVPVRFVMHEQPFPLLPSGKTDVRRLTHETLGDHR